MSNDISRYSITGLEIPKRKSERDRLLEQYPGLLHESVKELYPDSPKLWRSKCGYVSRVFHYKQTSRAVKGVILRVWARRIARERKAIA